RDPGRALVARHEAGPRRRRHRRGAVGAGRGRHEARQRTLREALQEPGGTVVTSPVELAPPDHTYLHLDTKTAPMVWAMVMVLAEDGEPLSIDDLRARVRERATLFDIFRLGIREGRWRR